MDLFFCSSLQDQEYDNSQDSNNKKIGMKRRLGHDSVAQLPAYDPGDSFTNRAQLALKKQRISCSYSVTFQFCDYRNKRRSRAEDPRPNKFQRTREVLDGQTLPSSIKLDSFLMLAVDPPSNSADRFILPSEEKTEGLEGISVEISSSIEYGGLQSLSDVCRGCMSHLFSIIVKFMVHVMALVNDWCRRFNNHISGGQLHAAHPRVGIGWKAFTCIMKVDGSGFFLPKEDWFSYALSVPFLNQIHGKEHGPLATAVSGLVLLGITFPIFSHSVFCGSEEQA